ARRSRHSIKSNKRSPSIRKPGRIAPACLREARTIKKRAAASRRGPLDSCVSASVSLSRELLAATDVADGHDAREGAETGPGGRGQRDDRQLILTEPAVEAPELQHADVADRAVVVGEGPVVVVLGAEVEQELGGADVELVLEGPDGALH